MKVSWLVACPTLAFFLAILALTACGKVRGPSEPPLPQPTPNATVDAVVRGVVTMVVPTPTGNGVPTNTVAVLAQRGDGSTEMRAVPGQPSAPTIGGAATVTRPPAAVTPAQITPTSSKATPTGAPPTLGERKSSTATTAPIAAATTVPTPDGRAVPVTPVVGSVNAVVKPRTDASTSARP